MVKIIDATGNAYGLKIDSTGHAAVRSVTEPHDRGLADLGKVWSYYFTATPTGAGDYFFYLKNTGTEEMHITDIRIMCAAADTFTYEKVSGTPAGGSAVTPQNRNFGSSKLPTATAENGADITGLTSEGTVFFERADTANKLYHLRTSSNIHLPQGSAMAIKAATGTALVTCVVSVDADEQSSGE